MKLLSSCRYLLAVPVLAFVAFLSLNATAAVDVALTGDPATDSTSWVDLAKPVYDAFAGHNAPLGVCLALVLVVALIKRYAGSTGTVGKFLHGDAGGSLLVLVGSAAAAAGAALGTPGAHVDLTLIKQAALVGVSAAGGYAMVKNLIVEPVLKPLAAKAPAWAQPIFALVFAIFDHPPAKDQAESKSTAAGQAAVVAKPATGADGITGAPTQVK